MQPEGRALRIHRVHDPIAAGNLHRSVEDLAAVGLDAFGGGVHVGNSEVDRSLVAQPHADLIEVQPRDLLVQTLQK